MIKVSRSNGQYPIVHRCCSVIPKRAASCPGCQALLRRERVCNPFLAAPAVTAAVRALQVMTPEVHHGSRAEPEHLQRLTEYVAHLESSTGAS